jgi:hypothetical protein
MPQTSVTCPGVPLIWDPDNPLAVFLKYPWARRHGFNKSLGYHIGMAHYDGDKFKYFSIHLTKCCGAVDVFSSACSVCTKATVKVKHLKELVKQSTEWLNFRYQSHDQLVQGHQAKNKIIDNKKLAVTNNHSQIIPADLYPNFTFTGSKPGS